MKSKAVSLTIAFLLLAGCASTGRQIDQQAVAKIIKGQTTQTQVDSLLGPPTQQMRSSDGSSIYVYVYSRSDVKAATLIPVVGAFAGGATSQNQTCTVMFDPSGVVRDIYSSSGQSDTSTGLLAH